jgi:hypothetical protein
MLCLVLADVSLPSCYQEKNKKSLLKMLKKEETGNMFCADCPIKGAFVNC